MNKQFAPFNRHVGLVVLDVTMSNPNGDPDMESEPRTRELDSIGMISPVSFKRKFRDLVEGQTPVYKEAELKLKLNDNKDGYQFNILERRQRDRNEIKRLDKNDFVKQYWDARLFGNTFLESLEDSKLSSEEKEKKKKGGFDHLINTGTIQVGVGLSVAPIEIIRMTNTGKASVQEGKRSSMAPLAFRVVQHGIYYIPIYVNPSVALKTGAIKADLDLFKFMLPYVYQHTASAIRPQISILHAWFAEHKNTLGSCPEHLFIEALKPRLKEGVNKPLSALDYDIPDLEDETLKNLVNRFNYVEDLIDAI